MKKFTITLALSILAVLLVATPCNAKGKAKHVVLIGLDGWGEIGRASCRERV